MSQAWPFILLGAAGFVGVWTFVLYLLWAMGWRGLQTRYRYDGPPPEGRSRFVSGSIGPVRFNNCLTVGSDGPGLYLAAPFPFGLTHKPVLIPWGEVEVGDVRSMLFAKRQTLRAGGVAIELAADVFDRYRR